MAKKAKSDALTYLDEDAETALFSGDLQGLVALCHSNERPLQGLCGLIDWRLGGALSRYIKSGAFSGANGELVYIPIRRIQQTYHILLLGAGESSEPGQRKAINDSLLLLLLDNLSSLKLNKIGLSLQDFGLGKDDFHAKKIEGISLCLTR